MYKKAFFKIIIVFLIFFFFSRSDCFGLTPSYLFLNNNRINTSNVEMLLLLTPSADFSSGSEVTILFPDSEDGQWCKQNGADISVVGASTSKINTPGWEIDLSLPGTLLAKCYQGSGLNSHDRIVVTGLGELSGGTSYGLQINPSGNFSTGLNVGNKNIIVQLKRGFVAESTAFSIYLQGLSGLTVTGFVNEDIFSVVQVLDSVVEKGIGARVRVHILDSKGNPIPNRSVQLGLNLQNLTNWAIEQPTGFTNSNGVVQGKIFGYESRIVNVKAVDKSFSQDVNIQSTSNLTVTDVATITLKSLPMYTTGLSRKITWNPVSNNHTYFIECSLQPDFKVLAKESGWISANEFTFQSLEYGKAYYYRGKVKNAAGIESSYSNIVTSIQSEPLPPPSPPPPPPQDPDPTPTIEPTVPVGTIEVLDPSVERGMWSSIRVRILDSKGNPLSNRRVELNIDRPLSNWEIEQPPRTDNNGYAQGRIRGFEVANVRVTAVDKTSSPEYLLDGFGWLRVTQLPSFNLHSLPEYSKGLARLLTWGLLQGNYEYYVESSTDPNFTISRNSGWISTNRHTFTDLKHGQGYFYRGKLRNSAKVESSFSTVVSSIQDNLAPTIEEVDFEILESQGEVKFTFLIKSLSPISLVQFRCKNSEGDLVPCAKFSSLNNFHYALIENDSLNAYETKEGNYRLEYCVHARDIVGNSRDFCDEKNFEIAKELIIKEETREEETVVSRIFTPIRQTVDRVFTPVRENVQKNIEDAVVFVQDLDVDDERIGTTSVAIVSAVTPATIISIAANPVNYQLGSQLLLGLAGVLRRRKKILPYGYVYDSLTKEPINKAIVRIYRENKLITTTVTNVYGAFTANLEPGEYLLKVSANKYTYPSKLITGSTDAPLQNIYRGGKFLVEEESQLQYSIPLDPVVSLGVKSLKVYLISYLGSFFLALQRIFVVVGLLIALFLYLRNPDKFNLIILLAYLPLLSMHLFLSVGSAKHSFGVVRDKEGRLLKGVILALREMEFEKIVAKRVTNERGRYKFLVPGGKYRLEVLTPGYKVANLKEKGLLFKGSVKKPLLVNKNIVLEKGEK